MCFTCLPCIGVSAVAGYKVNKTVDKAFSSKQPQEPVEPGFVTEAKLRWNLNKWKPGDGAPPAGTTTEAPRPKRAERYNSKDRVKEQESKARLAELVEAHKGRTSSRR